MEDIYNTTSYSDQELYAILDLTNPTDRELEAKILHMIWKYENFGNASGDRLVRFFKEIYDHFFEEPAGVEGFTESTSASEPASAPASAPAPASASASASAQVQLNYTNDVLNPVFKQTTTRLVSIDSQYRNRSSITTDYTFNLSTPLKDVVNLKLYSIQIPYTWYTINSNFGSNFLYLKGQSAGITSSDYDIKVEIPVGNYTALELIDAVNLSFQNLKTEYTDISFGNTIVTYDYASSKATIKTDIKKTYTESDYILNFGKWTSPNTTNISNIIDRTTSIPSFLGYNYQSYETNILKSQAILPTIATSAADNVISRYTLTSLNNFCDIVHYTGTEYITDPLNCTVLETIRITLSLSAGLYSRFQLINDLNSRLTTNTKLIDSSMNRFDVADLLNTQYGNSYYSLRIKLNRATTKNVQNSKVAIVFPANDTSIWYTPTSAFAFQNRSNELSNLIAESTAPQSIITINSSPYISFRCKSPRFNGRTVTGNIIGDTNLNDYQIGNIVNSNYTLSGYTTEINRVLKLPGTIINPSNTSISINNSTSNIKIDIFKNFQANSYILDIPNSAFLLDNHGFNSRPQEDMSIGGVVTGAAYASGSYIIAADSVILTIKPKTGTANRFLNPYVIRNTTALNTVNVADVATRINTLFNTFTDDYGKRVLTGSTITFTQVLAQTTITLSLIVSAELAEEEFVIDFVDPDANIIESRLVSCLSKHKLAYSDDNGATWTGINQSAFPDRVNGIHGNNLIASGVKWVASGQGGNTLATSTDGLSWTGRGNNIFSVSSNKAAWNGSVWLATGEGTNTLARSTDGINWTGLGTVTFTTRANGIGWDGNVWVATGEGAGNTIAWSPNGLTWNGLGKTTFSTSGKGVIWSGTQWVATGEGGNTIATSLDGIIWIERATTSLFSIRANDVAYNGTNLYVAVGEGSTNTIATSSDGETWTGRGKTTFSTAGYAVTTSTSGGFIAVGEGGNTIVRSTNGTSWTGLGQTQITASYGIGWNGGSRIISSINMNEFAYSNDSGNTWSSSAQPTIFSDKANDAAYNGNLWLGTGKGITNTLATSTNGITWTGRGKSIFSTSANKAAWNGNIWVATGEGTNTLAKSREGINWTGLGTVTFSTRANGIGWNGNLWVAAGESTGALGNTLAWSPDGTNWNGLGKTTFETSATSVLWNGYIWIATGGAGSGNTIAMSYDGINWTSQATTALFSNGANDVAWHDMKSTWVAVGEGATNTIATSYDGLTWSGSGNITFTTRGSAVSISGSGQFVAAGEGGNTIVTSTDGITWTRRTTLDFLHIGYGLGWDVKTIGQNQVFYDVSNSWVSKLKLEKSSYVLSDPTYNLVGDTFSSINGTGYLETDTIDVTAIDDMNLITLSPNTEGVITGDGSNTLSLRIPAQIYTRDQLISAINTAFLTTQISNGGQAIASKSLIKVIQSTGNVEYVQIRLSVDKTYTSSDYKIIFYDPYSFVQSCVGVNSARNASWDSTLGWILGFHEATEYDLSVAPSITGDNVVSVNIYNYFMILLDDYNHNHMNDGVVTTTQAETDLKLPSYTNRAQSTIDPVTGNVIVSSISSSGTPLTQRQLYASQASVDQKKATIAATKYSSGPFAKNVFGLVPLQIATQTNNTIYVDYGTALQDQQRNYFGPVNIQRMSVKLINDRGETVDLNGANWSFSFICEQLYQNNRV
jgi:hypothetical protein